MLALLATLALASPGFGDPKGRCGGPTSTIGEQLRARTACLIGEAGPRSGASPAGRAHMRHAIAAQLPSGFVVDQHEGRFPTLIACRRGERPETALFLAHLDAVADEVPGAADNAASVAILLDVADALPAVPPRTVCLAFPDGEEVGLHGSRALARALGVDDARYADDMLRRDQLALVVSLDLIGAGALTWNGLGPAWDAPRLAALLAAAPADVPWVYRARSRRFPALERSDHGPFANDGLPAAHLMTRGPSGITWSYHTPDDDIEALEPETLALARERILALALSDAPGPATWRGEPAAVLPLTRLVLPGWLVLLGLALAAGLTVAAPLTRDALRAGWRGWSMAAFALLGAGVSAVAAGWAAAAGRPIGGTLADPVAAAIWLGALAGLAALGPRCAATIRAALAGALALVVSGILLAMAEPLLALPLLVAAAASGWAARLTTWLAPTVPRRRLAAVALVVLAILAAWPAGYLVRPGALRELLFHGLVPSGTALPPLFAATVLPVAIAWLPVERLPTGLARRAALGALLALTLGAIALGLLTPPWAEPYPERDERHAQWPPRR